MGESRAIARPALLLFLALVASEGANLEQAKKHYRAAIELANDGRWNEALAEYLAAQSIVESTASPEDRDRILPSLLNEIGLAAENIPTKSALAFDAFSRYLAKPPEHPNPAALAHAKQSVAKLKESIGWLEVQGPQGARVLVDEEWIGTLPLARPLPLARGVHGVRISADGWLPDPVRTEAVITGGDTSSLDVSSLLRKPVVGKGMVEIHANVPGVHAQANGQDIPLVAEVPEGLYRIEVAREGYASYTQAAKVEAGGQVAVDAHLRVLEELPDPASGTLEVRCGAKGATASVDGQPAPEILAHAVRVPIGPHDLLIEVPGGRFVPFAHRIEVAGGENPPLVVELFPLADPEPRPPVVVETTPPPPKEISPLRYGVIGTGAAALIVGGVLTGLTIKASSDVDALIRDHADPTLVESKQTSGRHLALAADILVPVGLLIGLAGLFVVE